MKKYDLIVVGGGPGGISSAIYAKRSNLSVAVITTKNSALKTAEKIENYYGFEKPVSGQHIIEQGWKQAKNQGIDIFYDEVLSIQYTGDFLVTSKEDEFTAYAIILATGAARVKAKIKGLKELEGRGVSYCAVCDGFFYRKKTVAVIGDQDFALHEAKYLNNLAEKVYILTNGKHHDLKTNIEVIDNKITNINGDNRVEGISFDQRDDIKVDGVFVAMGSANGLSFSKTLGLEEVKNKIVVNDKMETNFEGIYSCGDIVKGSMQIAKAVYEGSIAGSEAAKFVRKKKVM